MITASRIALRLGTLAFAAVAATSAFAQQTYPNRPVRIIVPFAAGGPTDLMARMFGARFGESTGQQVVIDNRVGAGGNIALGLAARAAPDGYTLLVCSSAFVVNPSLYPKSGLDPFRDYIAISNMAVAPNLLYVPGSSTARSVKELVALVKSQPGKMSIATPGIGTTPHLSAELFKQTFGLDLANIPFNGAAPAMQSTLANQTPIALTVMAVAIPHIKSGALRGLAVTAKQRSRFLPDVPSTEEAGMIGQEAETFQGLFVPAGTSKEIVARLHAEVVGALSRPDAKERMDAIGHEILMTTPAEFVAQIKAEIPRWAKVIKTANIKVD